MREPERVLVALCVLCFASCAELDVEADAPAGQEQLIESTIDVARWVIPDCAQPGPTWARGSNYVRVVPMGVSNGLGRLVLVKSSSGEGYEEWAVDSSYLYIRADTTWAFEQSPGGAWCDVQCGSGTQCQQRWNTNPNDPRNGLNPVSPWAFTVYSTPGQPQKPAPWIPRSLALPMGAQTQFTTHMEIGAQTLTGCQTCTTRFNTAPGQSVARTVRARRLATWSIFTDVLELTVQSGPGQGEVYHYAKDKGWVGFNNQAATGTVSSTPLPRSSCAGFSQGAICSALGWGAPTPPPTQPDVLIEDLTWSPAAPKPQDVVRLSARVRNAGGATPDVVGVGFFVDGRFVGWASRGAMQAGETATLEMNQTWTAPAAGTFAVRGHVDDVNRFPESNEGNNVREEALAVASSTPTLPNLVLEDVSWTPASPRPGDAVQLHARVRNGGAITPDVVGVGFFVQGQFVGWASRNPMQAGEVSTLSMNQRWTPSTTGTFAVRALADDVNRFAESNEQDNALTKNLSVSSGSTGGACGCRTGVDNFCNYGARAANCPMTFPGGYCDPNGDGSFSDADWVRGYNEYRATCR